MIQRLKNFLAHGNRANWVLFIILALTIFIKCCFGHFFMHHSILVSSLWNQPLYFWAFYLPKISISILLASFVFLVKQKWSLIVLSILIDIWIWANILYFRIYGGVIDGYVLMMASNLKGFGSSIISIIEWKDLCLFLLTILFAVTIFCLKEIERRCYIRFGIVFLSACLFWIGSTNLNFYRYEVFSKREVIQKIAPLHCFTHPFSQRTRITIAGTAPAYDYSILHMFFFSINDVISLVLGADNIPTITKEDEQILNELLGTQHYQPNDKKVILVLFESLENWVVQPEFMPNTYRLIRSGHSLHAHKLKKQTKSGGSADGQMILNTGLLPISSNAVCFAYPFNTFPSVPKGNAVTLLPHPIDVWNQKCMSPAYEYDSTIEISEKNAFSQCTEYLQDGYDLVQIVTLTSHEPFGGTSDIPLSTDMPTMMADYIRSVNCTDRYIGEMIDSLIRYNLLDNTTILITGDHTIFHKERRDKFSHYCEENNLNYGVDEEYCPLIIYSKTISNQFECFDEAYQMDAYSTLLNVLGYNDYYWKGFGVNLLDSVARKNRPISEQEAFILSDKLIRANWFESYTKEK